MRPGHDSILTAVFYNAMRNDGYSISAYPPVMHGNDVDDLGISLIRIKTQNNCKWFQPRDIMIY